MQFVVIANDYKDEKAIERRLAVRRQHLAFADKMFKQGTWLFSSALLDENGIMNGSVIFCNYKSEDELRKEWLENEAYVLGRVWEVISIRKVRISVH